MNVIDLKLIDAYKVLVMAKKYIISEEKRLNENQIIVPLKYRDEVEIKVAEKTIEVLEGDM